MESSEPLTPFEILAHNRSIEHKPESYIYQVYYKHPDPVITADIANLFMREFINFHLKEEIDGYMKIVEDLRIRIDQTDALIDASAIALEELKQQIDGSSSSKLLTHCCDSVIIAVFLCFRPNLRIVC